MKCGLCVVDGVGKCQALRCSHSSPLFTANHLALLSLASSFPLRSCLAYLHFMTPRVSHLSIFLPLCMFKLTNLEQCPDSIGTHQTDDLQRQVTRVSQRFYKQPIQVLWSSA